MLSHLSEDELVHLRRLLEDERTQVMGRSSVASILTTDVELQDRAAQEVERRDGIAVHDRERARLVEIEAALTRMRDGVYGVCEETGEPIPYRRLKLEPTTRYSVEALEMLEQEQSRSRVLGSEDDDALY